MRLDGLEGLIFLDVFLELAKSAFERTRHGDAKTEDRAATRNGLYSMPSTGYASKTIEKRCQACGRLMHPGREVLTGHVNVLKSSRTTAPRRERTFQPDQLCSLGYSPDSTVKRGMLLI